jgi:hypothetical protein
VVSNIDDDSVLYAVDPREIEGAHDAAFCQVCIHLVPTYRTELFRYVFVHSVGLYHDDCSEVPIWSYFSNEEPMFAFLCGTRF